MRRGLRPEDLGDLFDLPLTAVVSMAREDGTIFSRPVWHRWQGGRFELELPAGDRKIAMLERDPRLTLLLAEDAFPYRAIEVRGRAALSTDDYHAVAAEICRRYVEAYAPGSTVEAYMSVEPGVIARLEPDVVTCWDYADEEAMSPASG
jgi:PPOX class probable F420-dependent enzyme